MPVIWGPQVHVEARLCKPELPSGRERERERDRGTTSLFIARSPKCIMVTLCMCGCLSIISYAREPISVREKRAATTTTTTEFSERKMV